MILTFATFAFPVAIGIVLFVVKLLMINLSTNILQPTTSVFSVRSVRNPYEQTHTQKPQNLSISVSQRLSYSEKKPIKCKVSLTPNRSFNILIILS